MIALPVKQKNHTYIDPAVAQWLDVHFGDTSFDGRVFIGHRKSGGKGVYTMSARSLSQLKKYLMLIHASKRLDYYITANTVSGVSRSSEGLFGLQNIVVDIDCHAENKNADRLVESFLYFADEELWHPLSKGHIPAPNSIVRTGRGVQLWWAIKPCHSSCLFYYNQIKTSILDRLEEFLSDFGLDELSVDRAASSNAVGYYRLPGTYNTKAKRYGALKMLHNSRYDTHELLGGLTLAEKNKPAERKIRAHSAAPLQTGDVVVLHNLFASCAKRVLQLMKLRSLRNNEIGSETRNNLCFAVYNALRMNFDHEESMTRLRAFNNGFKRPLTERELEATLCSAIKKGGYKYTNASLIEFLEVTPEEQIAIGLHPFNGNYKPWAYAKPNATRDAVRKAVRDDRDAKIITMHIDGVSQAETARNLGISRNTVARVLGDYKAEKQAEEDRKETRQEVLKNGAIYDCLIKPLEEVASTVSAPEGQLSPSLPTDEKASVYLVTSLIGFRGGG